MAGYEAFPKPHAVIKGTCSGWVASSGSSERSSPMLKVELICKGMDAFQCLGN